MYFPLTISSPGSTSTEFSSSHLEFDLILACPEVQLSFVVVFLSAPVNGINDIHFRCLVLLPPFPSHKLTLGGAGDLVCDQGSIAGVYQHFRLHERYFHLFQEITMFSSRAANCGLQRFHSRAGQITVQSSLFIRRGRKCS
jgi:hypothetical protein